MFKPKPSLPTDRLRGGWRSTSLSPARHSARLVLLALGLSPLAGGLSFTATQVPSDPNRPAPPSRPSGATPAPGPLVGRADPTGPLQQDAQALEVLQAGIKALGGEQAIFGRKTIYIKRRIINHDYPEPQEGTVTLWFKRPDRIRKEIAYPERKHIEAYDGAHAWFDAGTGPQIRGPVVTASVVDGMSELDMPANYADADLTYFNISQEIPGKLAHVVKVRKNGYTKELMFDVTSHLLQVVGIYESPWGATDKMIKYDRYRPVDGLMVPWREERWRANQMVTETEILEIRFNAPIEDSMFQTPPNAAPPASPQSPQGAVPPSATPSVP